MFNMSDKKTNSTSTVSEEDAALFRRKMKGTRPVKTDRIVHNTIPKSPSRTLIGANFDNTTTNVPDNLADFNTDSNVDANQTLFFVRPGPQHKSVKKLKRGEYAIEAKLDLHGQTTAKAKRKLIDFIDSCQSSLMKCVIIIHGRGMRSQSGTPILKQAVDQWLREMPQVMAFSSAIPKDGGLGAVYVLLKRIK
jgi:DNA-nicking Smr family endonuclease